MQAYHSCIKLFGCFLVFLFIQSCSNAVKDAYYTRKQIRNCGCWDRCFYSIQNDIDRNTYNRYCVNRNKI